MALEEVPPQNREDQLEPGKMRAPRAFKIIKGASMLDDAPWDWKGAWCSDMPEFFQGMPGKGSEGVYANIYDELDDSPITWHITEPVDPTEYQNEWLGDVINIY